MLLVLSSNLSTFAWDALEDQRILKLVARDLPLCWSNTDEELKSIVIYLIIYNQTRQMPPPGFSGQNLIYYNTQWNDSCHQSSSQRIKLALRLQVVAKARARWKHYILSWTLLSGCSWKLMWGLRNAVSPASGSGCEQPRVPQLSPGWHTEHVGSGLSRLLRVTTALRTLPSLATAPQMLHSDTTWVSTSAQNTHSQRLPTSVWYYPITRS